MTRLVSHRRTLLLVLLATASVFPLQVSHRCRRTGMQGPGDCCAVRPVETPACASCGRSPVAPSRRRSGETGLHAFSGPCCLITYVESPRIGSASGISQDLIHSPASNAPATVEAIALGAEARLLVPHRVRAGPEPPAHRPLFILHASLLL